MLFNEERWREHLIATSSVEVVCLRVVQKFHYQKHRSRESCKADGNVRAIAYAGSAGVRVLLVNYWHENGAGGVYSRERKATSLIRKG